MGAYNLKKGTIITEKEDCEIKVGGKTIRVVPLNIWLEEQEK